MRDTKPKRPILRYHGGKWLLAKWIIQYFPKHKIYTEAFGGAASVLLQKRRSYAEVYNDKWETVVNVFNVIRNEESAKELKRVLELTPFARDEYMKTGEEYVANIKDPIEKARRTIFRSFAGFGSAATNAKHATGFRSVSRKAGSTPASDWSRYPNHIESFTRRLRGVIVENLDYYNILVDHDSEETLHYVDPPYVHSQRNMRRGNAAYAYEMTDSDHEELGVRLKNLKGMVIISGYDCELYRDIYSDWTLEKKKTWADGARDRKECIWLNPYVQDHQKQLKFQY